MKIDGEPYRSVWVDHSDGWSVRIIDQTKLPWSLEFVRLTGLREAAHAIRSDAGARRAADRGDRGLWAGAGAARRPVGTDAMERAAGCSPPPGRPR